MTNLFGNWANVSLHLRLLKTNITGIFLSFFLFFYPLTHFISHDSFNLTHLNNRIKEQKMLKLRWTDHSDALDTEARLTADVFGHFRLKMVWNRLSETRKNT